MFALQLPTLRVITLRGTNAPRGGGRTPAVDTTEPVARSVADHAAAAPRGVDPIETAAAGGRPADPDPAGLRVVPLRPDAGWPLRRGYDRVASPFRAFPYRSLHLSRMMAPADPRD
jgi:hypothetical protein